jgi:hypothetical protein
VEISGVAIGPDVRLLVPEDRHQARLFHRVAGDVWCETLIPRGNLDGSFAAGTLRTKRAVRCSGGHVIGSVVDGQWLLILEGLAGE